MTEGIRFFLGTAAVSSYYPGMHRAPLTDQSNPATPVLFAGTSRVPEGEQLVSAMSAGILGLCCSPSLFRWSPGGSRPR
ncbi:hypothetical protein NITMOv2_0342 [Nitrospira moscoviensis]|uniref:Uncharacterized protein n=1 Tax=Nitrospira moscoviensis TaxID=42253 RepID=A0A0K2G768_NITMO|nr:hypothetical protein NITMOv2_0342 [Nitrospira moscoviensis]